MTGRRLAAAALMLAVGLSGARAALADVTLYEEDGTKLTAAFAGALGFFAVGNVDFGAGDFNTRAPFTGAVPPSQRKTEREWVEASIRPSLAGEAPLAGYGTGYSKVSFVAQGTRGDGDAGSSLAQALLRSTTGDRPTHVNLEDAAVGWRSGDVLKDTLGTDGLDLSYGNQSLVIGDGLVIGTGIYNAFRRGAFYTSLADEFGQAAVARLNPDGIPLRGNVFKLEDRVDQHLMLGFDQPKARLAGFNVEWFKASGTKENEKKEGDDDSPSDVWSLGVLYFNIYDADRNPAGYRTGAFSLAPGATASSLSASANRDGLNVFSFRAAGSFLEFDRDILFHGEYVGQRNANANRRVDANGWYVEPGYKFSSLPWTPQVSLRYAQFSGESSPGGTTKHSYDPLFYAAGPRGYGSWYMGEIYCWYLGLPSNIDAVMASVSVSPLDTLTAGVIFYDFRFDKTAQFANPGITSSHALDEVDLYATWSPTKRLTLSAVLGFGVPGQGFKQAAASFVAANGGPSTSVGNTIVLGQLIATFRF